jgi:hypothetical protein
MLLCADAKPYAYIDETGQDAGSKFFLVSVVNTEDERRV